MAGLLATYGFRFGLRPREMDLGLLYPSLAAGQVDLVVGSATDGLIAALDMVVLQDDRHYFPPYDAVPIVRRTTVERHPQIRAVLAALGGILTADQMRELNYRAEAKRVPAETLAAEIVSRLPQSEAARSPAGAPR